MDLNRDGDGFLVNVDDGQKKLCIKWQNLMAWKSQKRSKHI